jgi:hypothetical protein
VTFYDHRGMPVAYASDGRSIYLFSGKPVGYLDGDSVYAYSGRHLGWFVDGWIRDHRGNCVYFTENARGGPVKPVKRVKPVRGVRQVRPVRGVRQVRPVRPVRSLSWSRFTGSAFFSQ